MRNWSFGLWSFGLLKVLSGVHFWSRECVKSAVIFVAPPHAVPLSLLRLSRAIFKYIIQKYTQQSTLALSIR